MAIKAVQEDTCVLCGRKDQNLRSDHLRECYKMAQDLLAQDQYTPVLTYDEMGKLQLGSNIICTNRKKCRNTHLTFKP